MSTARKSTKSSSAKAQQFADEAKERDAALKKSLDESAAALLEELKQGKSARLVQYLSFASRFYNYSANNSFLILLQCPEASHVAGYRTWEKMGYHVAKGAKGIRILAPNPFAITDEETGERHVVKMYFRTVAVFDASQLNAEEVAAKPLPEFYHDLGSDAESDALEARIVAAMQATGITVEARAIAGGAQGYSQGGYVATLEGLSSRNRIRTLVHEWAHELLHTGEANREARAKTTKEQRECHAEATSYVVLAHFGIHNEFSSDYLQNWGNTSDTLMQELATVQRASSAIIQALEAKSSADEASASA